jgi:hypothetical protein
VTVTVYKEFWEEVIAYFPLLLYGTHRKPENYMSERDTQTTM